MDGHDRSAGRLVGFLADMDGNRLETHTIGHELLLRRRLRAGCEEVAKLSEIDTTVAHGGGRNGAAGEHGDHPVVVAVSGLKRGDEDDGRYPVAYVTALTAAGAAPIVVSPFSELEAIPDRAKRVDMRIGLEVGDPAGLEGASGLVLTGGGDADPALYGRPRHPRTYNVNRVRDDFELELLGMALAGGLPVLAVCRGMQLLNVFLGGTLEQHLSDRPDRLEHDRDRPRAEAAHHVRAEDDSLLAKAMGTTNSGVNSHHHQSLERVADELEPIGWAEDDLLEAVSLEGGRPWVLGVQWHPEAMAPVDRRQLGIFRAFVEAADAARSQRRRGRAAGGAQVRS